MSGISSLRAELADLLICPISQEAMEDPVTDPCGHTFEAIQIQGWLAHHAVCPLSRRPLALAQLVPNRILKRALEILAHTPDPEEREPVAVPVSSGSILSHLVGLADEDLRILQVAIQALQRQRVTDAEAAVPDRLAVPQNFAQRTAARCRRWYDC